jgi:RNA polymerase sigma-70 factor (ECF subfamily)
MTLEPPLPPAVSDCASAASPEARALRVKELEALVRRHRTRALRLARKHLHNPSSADDVVQQAILVIFKELPRYEERGAFDGYLRTVLRNLCRMDNRALGARTRLLARTGVYAREAAADRESIMALCRAVANLSEPLRQVIGLRYCLGLSHGEIAERLGAPVGTVRRRNFDALRRLHAQLEGNEVRCRANVG